MARMHGYRSRQRKQSPFTVPPYELVAVRRGSLGAWNRKYGKKRNPRGNGVKVIALVGAVGLGGFGVYLAGKDGQLGPLQPTFDKAFPGTRAPRTPTGPTQAPRPGQPVLTGPAPTTPSAPPPGYQAGFDIGRLWRDLVSRLPGVTGPAPGPSGPAGDSAIEDLGNWGAAGFYWNTSSREVRTFNEGWLIGQGADSISEAVNIANTWYQLQQMPSQPGPDYPVDGGQSIYDLATQGLDGLYWNGNAVYTFNEGAFLGFALDIDQAVAVGRAYFGG